MKILLMAVGTSEYELDCARYTLTDVDWLESSFVLCDKDNSFAAEAALADRIHPSIHLDMMIFIAREGGQAMEQALGLCKIAREQGIFSIIVSESKYRSAAEDLAEYRLTRNKILAHTDSLLLIPGHRDWKIAFYARMNGFLSFLKLLGDGECLINLDFADLSTILRDSGLAYLNVRIIRGRTGRERAKEMDVHEMIPKTILAKACNAMIHMNVCPGVGLNELYETVEQMQQSMMPDANLLFGAIIEKELQDEIQMVLLVSEIVA